VTRCDVAVVGAGAAVAWAAYTLAHGGARIAILDPSRPREKPCGGCVNGRALAQVADAIGDAALPVSVIRSARFIDSTRGDSAVVPLELEAGDSGPPLVVTTRAEFDHALLVAAVRAGAAMTPSRLADVEAAHDGARLVTSHGQVHADVVIGADGSNSLVRRRVARAFPRAQLSTATGFFAHGITCDEIVIELVADPPGYIWSFPRPDHLAIGICAQADAGMTVDALRARVADWIESTRIAEGARLEPYSWPIPSLDARSFGSLDLAGSRWALAGDAAGLVDPITREGIYFALLSGQWIAEALISNRFPADYTARINDEIAPELACAARLKAGFYRPSFIGVFMQALQQSAAVRGVMLDLVAGRQQYTTLKWRLLKTFEIGLAYRLLARQ